MTFSAEEVDRVAKAIAYVIGHGMREKCERMAEAAITALLEQREAVTEQDVEVAGTAYFEQQWAILPPKSKQLYRFALKRALESYASRHARQGEPAEGHSVQFMSQDGMWRGEARWEREESAYVTQESILPSAQSEQANGVDDIRKARTLVDHVIHGECGAETLTEVYDLLTAAPPAPPEEVE